MLSNIISIGSIVKVNRTPVDLDRPCNSLFEFQVVHRYVFIVV